MRSADGQASRTRMDVSLFDPNEHFACVFEHFTCVFERFACIFEHFTCIFEHFTCVFEHFGKNISQLTDSAGPDRTEGTPRVGAGAARRASSGRSRQKTARVHIDPTYLGRS